MLLRRSYFPTTALDAVIDRRNLACNTRRGQNRSWVLGTIIYEEVKNILLKAGFYFLLSLHHPNNRLENIIFLFVPLQLNGNKNYYVEKILEGHLPTLYIPSYAYDVIVFTKLKS
jgi:hypothetical protein